MVIDVGEENFSSVFFGSVAGACELKWKKIDEQEKRFISHAHGPSQKEVEIQRSS